MKQVFTISIKGFDIPVMLDDLDGKLTFSDEEIQACIQHAQKCLISKYDLRKIKEVVICVSEDDDSYLDIKFMFYGNVPFDRIRRITGYLVGSLERWNNAKRAEERDRVKHRMEVIDDGQIN